MRRSEFITSPQAALTVAIANRKLRFKVRTSHPVDIFNDPKYKTRPAYSFDVRVADHRFLLEDSNLHNRLSLSTSYPLQPFQWRDSIAMAVSLE